MSGRAASVLGGVGFGLQAALLLARGRPDGLARLIAPPADPPRVAARSFVAMALCLPGFLLPDLWEGPSRPDLAGLAVDTLGYVVGWVGFAVLTWEMLARVERGGLWWRFIAAWNWTQVAQSGLLLAAAALPRLGAPGLVAQVGWLFAIGWALWIEWFAVRLTLQISTVAAAGMVVIDLMVSTLASLAANSVTAGLGLS